MAMSDAVMGHGRFLRWLAIVTIVIDLAAAGLAMAAEHGHAHAFGTYWAALFWTTTQLLTVSSQLPNPTSTAAHILDVALELLSITIVTSIAGSWAAFFHRQRHPGPAAPSAENGPSPSGASPQP
jgi:hypothetical protein